MEELEEIEEDAGLGNGGLGRLAGTLDFLNLDRFEGQDVKIKPKTVSSVLLLFFNSFFSPIKISNSVFLGFHGNAWLGSVRLRYPLRVWYFQPKD